MWVLILYVFASWPAKGDSVSLTSVPGFAAKADCDAAGRAAEHMTDGSVKTLRWICAEQKR